MATCGARSTSSRATRSTSEPSSRSCATRPRSTSRRGASRSADAMAEKRKSPARAKKPVLLSGGNPQIAKGYGDGPVQAYIDALTDWKRDACRRIDELVVRNVPKVNKAV